ncbi:hypothetical protein LXL04_001006 [Taraxacum kok-saghyz]
MVSEIESQCDIGAMLYNISTITLTIAQKRWRRAYFSIYFSNTMLSIAKLSRYPISNIVSPPSYTSLKIIPKSTNSDEFPTVDQTDLTDLVKTKDLKILHTLQGVTGLAKSLRTDLEHGINDSEIESRKTAFGSNTYKKPPPKGFVYFVVEAFKDTTILILLACAALSLGFGIKEEGAKEGWYEGGSIFVAVILVIAVSAVSNFRQERQFDKLSKISNNIKIDVVRNGRRQKISIFDVVVGDVVILNIGDQIPADGVFVDGYSLLVDESSMTGESDHIDIDGTRNPFLFSGSKVADGHGRMLVVSVGMNTAWGEMMSSVTGDSDEQTPLQSRLNKLTSSIGKVGLAVAFFVLVVMLIRYFTGNTEDEDGNREYNGKRTSTNDILNSVTRIFAAAVTIVVVAIPEGLPLAVTLTLAYSMKRMMADQAMVRKLSACETMGSATVICTDKTGTLTLNQMKVTQFWLGLDLIEDDRGSDINTETLELYHQGVGLNTTGTVYGSGSGTEYSGSPTEKAILSWAVTNLGMDMEKLKQDCNVLHVATFNSEKKRSGVSVMKKEDDSNSTNVHWKGAAEIILSMCSNYYQKTGVLKSINHEEKTRLENIIQGMAASSLRCIAFAHKQIPNGTNNKTLTEKELTLLGIVGIKDPCRPGAKEAIDACRSAGVEIKMITGDNVFTAKAIATECGILKVNQGQTINKNEVIEGEEFRNYTDEERMEIVDNIKVMARSSPFDKLLMVQCLKKKGHVVAVTGDGTNDAPALKEADIGLSMGIQGTEVAKESSDIVILDDDFASVAVVLRWGRCVYNNIQKFIQFQLTVNVAALVINFVAAVSAGALALATERPTNELMHNLPVGRVAPLITNVMWRNLLAQAMYQITVLLTFQFKGKEIFDVDERVKNTIIFNTFVFCQVFNEFNSRKLEKRNVFEGLHKNRLFIGIIVVTVVLQIVMVEFLKNFADTEKLNWGQWGICVGIAALSWPIGWFVKLIPVPDRPVFSYIRGGI